MSTDSRWSLERMTGFLSRLGIDPDSGARRDPVCPDCLGSGRIEGFYGQEYSSQECPTCAPDEPLPAFTEAELDLWERQLEERDGSK